MVNHSVLATFSDRGQESSKPSADPSAKVRGLVFGITTAGDEESELLIRLYKVAEEDTPERFGYPIWEAPEASVSEDGDLLAEYIKAANPSVAEGRRDIEDEIAAARSLPEADALHHRLNRFVASLNPFLPYEKWKAAQAGPNYSFPTSGPLVFTVDMTPEDSYATVAATRKDSEGHLHTELVA
jgi:hypothetical protein